MAAGHIRWRGKTDANGKPIAGKGAWHLQVYAGRDPRTGKHHYRSETFKGTKREAERRLSSLVAEVQRGVVPSKRTVGDWMRAWLQEYAETHLRPRTAQTYRSKAETYIIPSVGHVSLAKLSPSHIVQMRAHLLREGGKDGRPLSPRSVLHAERVLHEALRHAMLVGHVSRNVMDLLPRLKVGKPDLEVLRSTEALEAVLIHAKGTRYDAMFRLDAWTGLRRGELLALRWSDVDLLGMTLRVCRSLTYLAGKGLLFQPPKSGEPRTVALRPAEALALREHRIREEGRARVIGVAWTEDRLVFCQQNGRPLWPDDVTAAFRRIADLAGYSRLRLHDLRHSHATILASKKVHVRVVQERLGHSEPSTTVNMYTHLWEDAQGEAMRSIGEEDAGSIADEERPGAV